MSDKQESVGRVRLHPRAAVLAAALALGALWGPTADLAAGASQLTIVHTNHVIGHLFPCPT
jgi:hypothetical protein